MVGVVEPFRRGRLREKIKILIGAIMSTNQEVNPENTDTEKEESFAELFEKSAGLPGRFSPGQKVSAMVVSVSSDGAYIDLGGKTEGVIDIAEFRAEDGSLKVKAGDMVEAFFIGSHEGVRKFTTLVRGYSASSLSALKEAHEAGVPIAGEVKRELKGGFEVTAGGVRCFCPFSQIDLRPSEASAYVGKTLDFKVIEFSERGRNVVLSRRALLEEERRARIEELKATLSEGSEVPGTVRAIQDFGAFVDIGGFDGLIPSSEMSWDRGKRPADVLSVGQEVTAKVIAIDWDKNRLTLSLKAMQQDPWINIADRYPEGSKTSGVVVRLEPFGAFVNVEHGIDGLIHISNLGTGKRIHHPKEVVEVGQLLEVYVIAVDQKERKLSLSLQPKRKVEKIPLPEVGEIFDAVVEKAMPFGVFVKLPSGLSGLVPNSEMATQRGADHGKMFPSGSAMKVEVIEIDAKKGKVLLSRKAVLDKTEKAEFDQYMGSVKKENGQAEGLGTLGEKLKAEMDKRSQ